MLRLRVKEVAENKGISMSRLSRLSDVSFNTVKNIWKHPEAGINVHTLHRIAKALDVPIADLLEEIPDNNE